MAMAMRSAVGAPWRAVSNAVASSTPSVRCVVETRVSRRATVAHEIVERDVKMHERFEVCEQSRMYYGRRGGGDAYVRPAAEEVTEKSTSHEVVAAFEAALVGVGRNAEALCEMAMRAWRKLGDADRAEQLYLEALQIAPENSAVQASYAQFLWQCDS